MIGKQVTGTSFRSVLNYNEEKVKKGVAEIIGSNMLCRDSRSLAKEFGMIRALKPNLSKAVYHVSLSISPEENLTNDQFQELGEKYLEGMGYRNSQFVIYRHTDTECPHIHIIANRIDMEGKVVSDKWNFKRSENIIRELEIEFGLQQVKSSSEAKEKALSKGEFEFNKRTALAPIKVQLQEMIKEALKFSADQEHFQNIMNQMGANVQFHKSKSGQTFGISFEYEGVSFKGSKLGKAYSWNKIKTQLNNGKDKTAGQTTIKGEDRALRSAGTTLAEYKQEKHTRINRGSSSHYCKSEWDSTFDKTGSVRNSSATKESKSNDSKGRVPDRKNERSKQRSSGSQNITKNESISILLASGSDNWGDDFSRLVSELNNKQLENNYDNSEKEKKKKRKKKKLDSSKGMSM
ncbi:relaxase/mobilization nuclease domain-containing protein [Marinifilum sp.]|uniref:relaxase/mobilization nuclease domain-containing protein n=1 Tax=Marinifilum sp. TaxID=2033137 RepID=UPI003BABA078